MLDCENQADQNTLNIDRIINKLYQKDKFRETRRMMKFYLGKKLGWPLLVGAFLLFAPHFSTAQQFVEHFRFGERGQAPGQFNEPRAIALADDGTLFVVDSQNNRIQLFTMQGKFLKSVGGFGFAPDQFDLPTDIWVKAILNIYVSDYNNRRLQRYDRNMNYLAQLTSNPNWPEEFQFAEVLSCAVNSQNDLFILDRQENKVVKINRNGQPERFFGTYESGMGELREPVQLDIFRNRWLLVSDVAGPAIMVFDFFGTFVKEISSPLFKHPSGLATHDRWGIFVADDGAGALFRIKPDLQTIDRIRTFLQKPLTAPRDVAVFNLADSTMENNFFIVDGNRIIAGKFTEKR